MSGKINCSLDYRGSEGAIEYIHRELERKFAEASRFFENYVVMELVKNYACAPRQAILTFYRDDKAREIDVFVEENGSIHPLEIKMSANPDKKETRKFDVIGKTTLTRGKGGIICMVQRPFPMNAEDLLIPANLI